MAYSDRQSLSKCCWLNHEGGNYDTCFTAVERRSRVPLYGLAERSEGLRWNTSKPIFLGWPRISVQHLAQKGCRVQANQMQVDGSRRVGWLPSTLPELQEASPLGRGPVLLSNLTWASPVRGGDSGTHVYTPGSLYCGFLEILLSSAPWGRYLGFFSHLHCVIFLNFYMIALWRVVDVTGGNLLGFSIFPIYKSTNNLSICLNSGRQKLEFLKKAY